MPAKRVPTSVLALRGAFDKDPKRGRERANEPKPQGPLGAPPEDFLRDTPEMKKHLAAWFELIDIAPPGVLTKSDRQHVKRTAQLMVKCDRDAAKDSTRAQLRAHLADIGCTPVGRTRIQVEHGKRNASESGNEAPDGWATLDAERTAAKGRTN